MHSVNTLSYAAPFKTAPPKPRGPAPFDAADPRTWDHAQTVSWLTDEFTKRARTRIAAAHKVNAQRAARLGKKLKPLDPAAPVPLPVDVGALCPAGMTAKHYGAMYTTDFVQRCLEAARPDPEFTPHVVKGIAAEVVGQLYYLILSAKTRKRRNIMKSRKVVDLDTYGMSSVFACGAGVWMLKTRAGNSPYLTITGTDVRIPAVGTPEYAQYRRYTDAQYLESAKKRAAGWYEVMNAAVVAARERYDDVNLAEFRAVMQMMEEDHGIPEIPA